jgi:O-acetyl-ADP-ribose deacetylase (regulator of RNase III)
MEQSTEPVKARDDRTRRTGMQVHIGACVLELVTGDITRQTTDAIVNAANSQLAGGGGVDGAIHRAGGPGIMAETRQRYPQGCPTGDAVITGAGQLPARYVIHAVGPIWHGGQHREAEQLASAYQKSLTVAVAHQCHSIAFPSLSTGAYGYPVALAAPTALTTVIAFLREHQQPSGVRFVLFDSGTYTAYATALGEMQDTDATIL